jgi:hypothetical protein
VAPSHPAAAGVHRNRAVVVVRPPIRRRVRVRRLCFSVVAKVQAVALAAFPRLMEPRLEQVRRGTRMHSQRMSGRSVEYLLLQEETAH